MVTNCLGNGYYTIALISNLEIDGGLNMEHQVHSLKIYPVYFEGIIDGSKLFEIRKNDRNFQVGDVVLLKEYNPDSKEYTGRKAIRQITYITDYAQQSGYVVFSIR